MRTQHANTDISNLSSPRMNRYELSEKACVFEVMLLQVSDLPTASLGRS